MQKVVYPVAVAGNDKKILWSIDERVFPLGEPLGSTDSFELFGAEYSVKALSEFFLVFPSDGGNLLFSAELPPSESVAASIRCCASGALAALPMISNLLEESADENSDAYVNAIQFNCYKLLRNAQNLSCLSRIESPVIGICDIADVTRKICFLTKSSQNTSAEFSYDIPDEPIITDTDSHIYGCIITNLISNALQYTRDRNAVNLSLIRDGKNIVVRISDCGAGIRSEILPYIFQEYFSASPLGSDGGVPGLGLGLPIARRGAAALGGRLLLESTFGTGTTALVTLPIVRSDNTVMRSSSSGFAFDKFSDTYIQLCLCCELPR